MLLQLPLPLRRWLVQLLLLLKLNLKLKVGVAREVWHRRRATTTRGPCPAPRSTALRASPLHPADVALIEDAPHHKNDMSHERALAATSTTWRKKLVLLLSMLCRICYADPMGRTGVASAVA